MSILDDDLDVLSDSPSQEAWPTGSYIAEFSANITEKEGRPTVIMGFKFLEVAELTTPSDADTDFMPKQVGKDQTVVVCALMKRDGTPNEMGQGPVKAVAKVFAESGYPSNLREWAAQVKADKPKVSVTFKRRVNSSTGEARNEVVALSVL
jgi:hypothetical protein